VTPISFHSATSTWRRGIVLVDEAHLDVGLENSG
jgi:hypothetical protein